MTWRSESKYNFIRVTRYCKTVLLTGVFLVVRLGKLFSASLLVVDRRPSPLSLENGFAFRHETVGKNQGRLR